VTRYAEILLSARFPHSAPQAALPDIEAALAFPTAKEMFMTDNQEDPSTNQILLNLEEQYSIRQLENPYFRENLRWRRWQQDRA